MAALKDGSYTTHIWHVDPKTGVRKWVGQIRSPEDALAWRKKQADPSQYVINNVGPPVNKTMDTPQPKSAAPSPLQRRMEEDRRQDRQRRRERALAAKAQQERVEQDRKAMAKVRDDAEKIIEGHKADEAKDLKEGRNR